MALPIRFGPYELDPHARELRSASGRVRLQDQPFEILQLLLAQPGHVVTRDQIRERLWPAGTFVDFEHSLNAAVKRLRAALGDDAECPRYVETVPRRGYRFVACLSGEEPEPVSHHVRLAVLAFSNLSADRDRDYFSDGLTEEMTAKLGQVCGGQVGIISSHSAMQFRNSPLSVEEIGQKLRADYVLMGSVRWEGERVRITARLVKTSNETQLWSEMYDRHLTDCLDVQSEVAARIARSLATELVPPAAPAATPPDAAAYQSLLKGRYYWRKTADTGVMQALSYYEEALSLDQTFAAAHAGVARVHILRAEFYHEMPRLALEKAREAAECAHRLAPNLTDAHLTHADLTRYLYRDTDQSRGSYKRAVALNPSHEGARIGYAKMLAAVGEFPQAAREADRARELDPMCLTANATAAWVRYLGGDYDTAVSLCRDTLEMDNDYVWANRLLGGALLASGRRNEAMRTLERVVESHSRDPLSLAWLAYARTVTGDRVHALDLLEHLQRLAAERYVSPYHLAIVHFGLGNLEATCKALRQAEQDRDPMLANLNVDPRLSELRQRPDLVASVAP
jgi:TolB-like protein/tetratricopeptide (TPR) repeat protein